MGMKLLKKKYIFSFLVLFGGIIWLLAVNANQSSAITALAVRLLFAALLIVVFFDVFKLLTMQHRNSYRTMIMERPLFNPKAKGKEVPMKYALYPRFIALYVDHDGADPYESKVLSLQAVRYEQGVLTDGLFLPLLQEGDKKRGIRLPLEDAFRFLKTYTKDFPLIVHEKMYAHTWFSDLHHWPFLMDAIDTEDLARMLYPKQKEFDIEAMNDFYRFEVDEEDPVYGAKITAAIYLDYLRTQDYKTTLTREPWAKTSDLLPIQPGQKVMEASPSESSQELWREGEAAYAYKVTAPADLEPQTHYIGPFTPLDEEGYAIHDSGPASFESTSEEVPFL
ncbi:hypothetical protein ABB02_01233 [Clostridiaceae bacterium JG1575]|nr:hypothetical protein ABB02_01233 [Clostridiaceae bacterium JG1575]